MIPESNPSPSSAPPRRGGRLRKIALTLVGASLLLLGALALVLPGPGMLLIVAGLAVLAMEYEWARRRIGPIRARAFGALSAAGANTAAYIATLGAGVVLLGLGLLWAAQPGRPGWFPWSEQWWLPGGVGVALSLLLSSGLVIAPTVWSRHRPR